MHKNLIRRGKTILWSLVVSAAACALAGAEEKAPAAAPAPDRALNHQIHSAIVEDPTLPYSAHVIKVTAKQGVVTLKGTVHSEEEKSKVEETAARIAGEDKIITDIAITDSKLEGGTSRE